MRVRGRLARSGVLAIVVVSGMGLLAGVNAAAPAVARVDGGAVPAGSGGSQQWVSFYTGPGAQEDDAQAIAVARNGAAVFVTGWSTSADQVDRDYATVAYKASTGAKMWARRYTGVGGMGGIAQAVAVDPAGKRVFVTGYSLGQSSFTDYVTIAYNAVTGARLWLGRYDGPGSGHDYGADVVVSPDGSRVFVTGSSRPGSPGRSDYATVAYDAATGKQLWVTRYSGPGGPNDTAYSLAVGPGGKTVYVTGRSGRDIATVAYNAATGGQLWVSRRGGGARAVTVSPDGHVVYVAGSFGLSYGTVAYNAATGTIRWQSKYSGKPGSVLGANSLAVSPSGTRLYVTGVAFPDFETVAYDAATGARSWARRFNGPGNSYAFAPQVAVGPHGHTVYIAGGPGRYAATVAYNAATGATQWVRLHRGTGTALAVDHVTGAVYVTGGVVRTASFFDYMTIAYHG